MQLTQDAKKRYVSTSRTGFKLDENKELVTVKKSSQGPCTLVFLEHPKWFMVIHVKFGEDARDRSGVDGLVFKESTPEAWRFQILDWSGSKNFDCVRFHERQINALDRDTYAIRP
jgi:hypothetical protein